MCIVMYVSFNKGAKGPQDPPGSYSTVIVGRGAKGPQDPHGSYSTVYI